METNNKQTAIVEDYFNVCLYFLILTGFLTLAATGKLDTPWTAIVALALLFRGWLLLRHKNFVIPQRWTSLLSLTYLFFYVVDFFLISRSFVSSTVHMVLFSMMLKMFSVLRNRDHLYLAVLSFLMVLSAALLTIDALFLAVFFVFMLLAVMTFASMEMKRSGTASTWGKADAASNAKLTKALSSTGIAIALAIITGAGIIFFIIPRASAGYLSAYSPRNDLVTGFSQDVRLGDIGQIKQSSSVVMHIEFSYSRRIPADLKWRGVALSTFDGRRWYNNSADMLRLATNVYGHFNVDSSGVQQKLLSTGTTSALSMVGRTLPSYRVVMEPIGTNVFFLATMPFELIGNYREVALDEAGSVFNNDREKVITTYEGRSRLQSRDNLSETTPAPYPPQIAITYLQLPPVDKRIKQLAEKVTSAAGSDFDKAAAIESHLRTQFGYTLELPSSGTGDPLAYFLFQRRKGHCEYFASAMAVMLRTLGIPSRIVNGFRNGQYNDLTGSYIIRASDAHSWVEAYISGYGWTTFDPTPPDPLHEVTSWARVMLYVDATREFWREWVINYDDRHQRSLGRDTGNRMRAVYSTGTRWIRRKYAALVHKVDGASRALAKSPARSGKLFAAFLAGVIFLVNVRRLTRLRRLQWIAWRPRTAPKMAAGIWYARMTKTLARRGWPRSASQTPREFAQSVKDPRMHASVGRFTEHYERARFADSAQDAEELPRLYEEINTR